jgi:hypothetical protein
MKLLSALIAALSFAVVSPAHAVVTLTAQAQPGFDLSNIHVGDSFGIQYILSGDAGDHFVSGSFTLSLDSVNLQAMTYGFTLAEHDDLSTNPVIFKTQLRAFLDGPALVNGTISGDFVSASNLRVAAAPLSFTVLPAATSSVPEPATWAMMIGGMGAIGAMMRRRRSALSTLAA